MPPSSHVDPQVEPVASEPCGRIDALDILRGVALLGIFLMNVEWFTRPISQLGTGVDINQTGLSYVASWLIYTFVQGKFWTMFSLLFGMGFAVMLGRSETRNGEFEKTYLRRILGLMLLGVAHYVLVWTGDILHDYAFTALALLLIVHGRWKPWLATVLTCAALALAIQRPEAMGYAGVFALVGILLWYARRGPVERFYRAGVLLYSLPLIAGLGYATVTAVQPQWTAPPEPTAEQLQKREERKIEREKERAEELKISTSGGYWESVQYRASLFAEKVPETGAFKLFTLSMFMIGFWFVRSGAITSPGQNAALFSRLAKTMLPLGLAMTLTSVMLRSHFEFKAGVRPDTATMYAAILFQWGALPLCIGYVAAMVCALRSQVGVRLLSPFRHAGRMALSNYIAASIVGTWFFYGYGLGFWGEVPRAGQVLFVAVVFAAQMWLSYFWLRHFRYGPLEWAWRAFTYWALPPMRRQLSTREPEAALAPPVPAG